MAPKKKAPGRSKGVKRPRAKKSAPRARVDSSDDDVMEDRRARAGEAQHTSSPVFGKVWMLFRLLMIGATVVSFAPTCGSWLRILTAAAAAGAVWARSGSDGKDGTVQQHHADSRVHRYGREVGFRRANQAEIDADPRSRQVYAQLRGQVNSGQGGVTRVRSMSVTPAAGRPWRSSLDTWRRVHASASERVRLPRMAVTRFSMCGSFSQSPLAVRADRMRCKLCLVMSCHAMSCHAMSCHACLVMHIHVFLCTWYEKTRCKKHESSTLTQDPPPSPASRSAATRSPATRAASSQSRACFWTSDSVACHASRPLSSSVAVCASDAGSTLRLRMYR